jgi:hypothetical protein
LTSTDGAGSPAPAISESVVSPPSAPAATHLEAPAAQLPASFVAPPSSVTQFEAPAAQLPAGFVVPPDTFASTEPTTSNLDFGNGAGSPTILPVASMFSSESAHGLAAMDTGHSGPAELPFMLNLASDESLVYSESSGTPQVSVSDFGTDWFFV